ncbi:hypothetical protein [Bradyrhizobium lablabi]|uniref:hypothetical protein n=1 Tax=Bradyrhizobium lablabi TaxID=722472 RepID=UPI001BABEF93|nr:hypothetical protein [Bradyrhizobium lablabi]MBR0695822.1 hypothetical protein [Bradyrhizobium lablabi]
MSQSPGNATGLNNSSNAPSKIDNTPSSNQGTTTGLANPSQQNQLNGDLQNSTSPPQGTNAAGTANSSGVGGGGTLGSNAPTTTREGASDAQIDTENRRADQKTKSICKGC